MARAQETVFAVNSTADLPAAAPGDGVCAAEDGTCTLRAAIEEANALPGPWSIHLPEGAYPLTLDTAVDETWERAETHLAITGNVRIVGAGAGLTVLDGGGTARVFEVAPGATLRLSGLTVRNGAAQQGGGIMNHGTLIMADGAVTGNSSLSGGGGIYNMPEATAALENVEVSGNVAERSEKGGGIFNSGSLEIHAGSVSDNTAATGGGMHNEGMLLAMDTRITGNEAVGGGGVENEAAATLIQVTITNNEASFAGGVLSYGHLMLVRSAVEGNTPTDCAGGVWVMGSMEGAAACPVTTLTEDTPSTEPAASWLADGFLRWLMGDAGQ